MQPLKGPNNQRASDQAREVATKEAAEVLQTLGTGPAGLTEAEAATRLEQYGPNAVAREKQHGWLQRFYLAARNPLVILLTVLAILTFATADSKSDVLGGCVMLGMVVLG